MNGFFISVEGVDGSGKSLLVKYLKEMLEKEHFNVCKTREPGGTPLAERIRDMLLDFEHEDIVPTSELLLFAAARAQHIECAIKPALERGEIVLCDRFYDTMFAYQGAGRNMQTFTKEIHNAMMKELKFSGPDLTILLDVSLETSNNRCRERGVEDRMDVEANRMKRNIIDAYRDIARNNRDRVAVINANHDFPTVLMNTVGIVEAFLNKHYKGILPKVTLAIPENVPSFE